MVVVSARRPLDEQTHILRLLCGDNGVVSSRQNVDPNDESRHLVDSMRHVLMLVLKLRHRAKLDHVRELACSVDMKREMAVKQPVSRPLGNEPNCHRLALKKEMRVRLADV